MCVCVYVENPEIRGAGSEFGGVSRWGELVETPLTIVLNLRFIFVFKFVHVRVLRLKKRISWQWKST